MKALLQSKTLYEVLKEIDFDKVSVVQESISNGELKLVLSDYTDILIPCEALDTPPRCQFEVRWDKIRDILGRVPEMPFVLILEWNMATLTFGV